MTCDFFVRLSDVKDEYHQILPSEYQLKQNYLNPYNPQTEIEYHVSRGGSVSLEIFNALGEKVNTLVSQQQDGGTHFIS